MERVLIQRVLERDPAGAGTRCGARGAARWFGRAGIR